MRLFQSDIKPPSYFCWMMLAAASAVAAGCDSGPDSGAVSGVVTFKGENVSEGTVTFYPVASGRPASGKIQPDGTYELSTFAAGDGAIVGEYKVAIDARKVSSSAPEPKSLQEEIASANASQGTIERSVNWLVPEKYSSVASSHLQATVIRGINKIDFNLP